LNLIKLVLLPITAPIKFIQEYFKTVIFLTILFFIFFNTESTSLKKANLMTINLIGPIMSADNILEKIKKAKIDTNIKGVLLNVNSPGGAVAPSIEIAYAIKELNKIKPVVAYAGGIMASGSYYSSIWATKIVANPGSIIGSIGVIMQSVDASGLLSKIGVKTQTAKIGKYKEVGTPTRKWKKYEIDELNKVIKNIYKMFVIDVASARNLKPKNHENYANAHIFTASQAKNVKLIDIIGTITTAKAQVIKLSKVKNPIWSKENKMGRFLQNMIKESISYISMNFNGLVAY
jgi:protease-4